MKKYTIIALIGESGSGKDTFLSKIIDQNPQKYHKIINCTTRPIRDGETNEIDYYFISPEEFADKVLNFEMIEATSFNDWFYGTSYDCLRSNTINIGVFNPDSIRALSLRQDIDLYIYKICCSEKNRLLRALKREDNPDIDEIIRRLQADRLDFSDLEFNYTKIPNNTKKDFLNGLKMIISDIDHLPQDKND